MDIISSMGLSGMNRGIDMAAASAERVVETFSAPGTDDGAAALVELSMSALQVRASAAIVKTGQEVQNSILSVIA